MGLIEFMPRASRAVREPMRLKLKIEELRLEQLAGQKADRRGRKGNLA